MAEYINKEDAIKELQKRIEEEKQCRYAFIDDDFIDFMSDLPAADVQEVKHGEWKAESDCGVTRCSVCGWTIEECIEDNYCRNCGAKMDGDVG